MNDFKQPALRTCHVIESAAAGSAGVMLALARAGVAAGQQVTIIYSPLRASPAFLHQLARLPQVRAVELNMQRRVGPHDAGATVKLWRLLRSLGGFDTIHSHSSKAGALARLARSATSARQVYSPHGFVTMAPDASRTYGRIEWGLSRLADAIVAVSIQEKEHAVSLGISPDKVIVIPNGVDLPDLPAAVPSPGPALVLGFVGRMSEQKNPLLAVEAVRRARALGVDVSLQMIGHGELYDAVQTAVAASGMTAHVTLLGAQPAVDHFPHFDALLCTSRFEGMPLTFLEALGFSVPIISTRVGGTDELVLDGVTGLLADSNPEAIALAIAAFARQAVDGRATMARRCQEQAGQFTTERMAAATFALYHRLVSGGSPLSA